MEKKDLWVMVSGRVLGVDVGGTFTDVFYLDEGAGRYRIGKVPSTPGDPSLGVLDGIGQQLEGLEGLGTIVHGTTVATNVLLERKGAVTGVITTRGFRDVLEMRRRDRPSTWGLWGRFVPLIPRDFRLEVDERTLASGEIHTAVDTAQVRLAVRSLLERGAQALCIFFINSYANPANERRALEAARELWPNPHISVSSAILPEIREFERASTTSLNAYLQPPVGTYLERLQGSLQQRGFGGQVLIVQSNGGVMPVETACAEPVRTVLSGPAAGVIAAAEIGLRAGYPNLITCDVGGTSFDVSLVAGGQSALTAQHAIEHGLVVRMPMIEITTIGAGGGSIAWLDRGGLLQVGPQSAGAEPGPVCYGLGGRQPTLTDAQVVLGRINARQPLGGKLAELDAEAARAAILAQVARPLGLGVMEGAEAILRIANARMAGAVRLVSIERGHDPQHFAALPFGGGGGLHVGALMREVGLAKALCPRFPGVASALGCVLADLRSDQVRTLNTSLEALELPALEAELLRLARTAQNLLQQSGITLRAVEQAFALDLLYAGQTHALSVPLPVSPQAAEGGPLELTRAGIAQAFAECYQRTYGQLLHGVDVRVINLRVTVIGRRPQLELSLLAPQPGGCLEQAHCGLREIWVGGGPRQAAVYQRLALPSGAVIQGPALLEQPDATLFIDPGLQGEVDAHGNVVLTRSGAASP